MDTILCDDEVGVILEFLDIFEIIEFAKSYTVKISWYQMKYTIKKVIQNINCHFKNQPFKMYTSEYDFLKFYTLCPSRYRTTKLIPRSLIRNRWFLNTTDFPHINRFANLDFVAFICLQYYYTFENLENRIVALHRRAEFKRTNRVNFIQRYVPKKYHINIFEIIDSSNFLQKNVLESKHIKDPHICKKIIKKRATLIAVDNILKTKYNKDIYSHITDNIRTYKLLKENFDVSMYDIDTWIRRIVDEVENSDSDIPQY